jgi:predicted nuclease of predicted toxin-antitoxin system
MSLKLLVDEDTLAGTLVSWLRGAGHDVVTAYEVGLVHTHDETILAVASQSDRVIVTGNCGDFTALHKSGVKHSGILLLFQYNNVRKEMSYAEILQAIANIEKSEMRIGGELISLNQWNFEPPQ